LEREVLHCWLRKVMPREEFLASPTSVSYDAG